MSDRTVHAQHGDDRVVRYDRTGKWYRERPGLRRRHLTVDQAVNAAVHLWSAGGAVHFGRPGGSVFDSRVRARSYIAPGGAA